MFMRTRRIGRSGKLSALIGISALALISGGGSSPTQAQTAPKQQAAYAPEEIVVTARKREESVMRTPVVLQVISAQQIKDLRINSLYDLEDNTPGLHVNRGFGAVGTTLYMRGIGSGDSGIFIDQSVALNLDGIGFSQGTFYKVGNFDLGQVEVLKGPQGLFFGKSTTAGIIAFHSADPTPKWETEVTTGYEFNAKEWNVTGYVSGPLTDKLGIRIAGYYDNMKGYIFNPNPSPNTEHRVPDGDDEGGRLTLKWDDPDTGFRAKLKVSTTHESDTAGGGTMNQGFNCVSGTRQITYFAFDDCKLDKYNQGPVNSEPYNASVDWLHAYGTGALSTGSPYPQAGDGAPFERTKTVNMSLQLDYDITPDLTITSVTGYGWVDNKELTVGATNANVPFQLLGMYAEHDYSEELRLTSHWKDSWFNFMVGGLTNPSKNHLDLGGNLPAYTIWGLAGGNSKTKNDSAFAQVLLTPVDKWEFDAGLRYTHIHKYFYYLHAISDIPGFLPGDPGFADFNQAPLLPHDVTNISEHNASPEFTLSYHPTDDWTLFTSYKFGYKGPGFNLSTFAIPAYVYQPGNINAGNIKPFGGERVKGVEGGAKAQLLDHHLDVTLTGYAYKYHGLQVSKYDNSTETVTITNSANALTKGLELGLNYAVPGWRTCI